MQVYGWIYLPVSIASGKLQLRNLASTQIIHEYIRLYDCRTVSQQSFDTNYSSLCLSETKIQLIFYVYRLIFRNFPVNSKGLVNIHKTKSQMTYIL